MARWIPQTLHVGESAEIHLGEAHVWIGAPDDGHPAPAEFCPTSSDQAASMAIALRLAAKRLEEIGKGLD